MRRPVFRLCNQVCNSAWQHQRYGNPPGTSSLISWSPGGESARVQYNPNAACGAGAVIIEYKAAAALYYYSAYQPNAAASSSRCTAQPG